ncbi:MAG: response regulator [Candidatus Nanopelagicales bacterium]
MDDSQASGTRTILLVEDNAADARKLERTLYALVDNVHVAQVRTGMEALAYLQRRLHYESAPTPELVILDLHLPGISGLDVLGQLKSDEATRRIPVLVLSATYDPNDVQRAYDAHANAFIPKPMGMEASAQLVTAIRDFWLGPVTLAGAEH